MNAPEKVPAAARRPEPHVMKTYGRLPVALAYGRGCWLWDTEGRKYLDGSPGSPSIRSATPIPSSSRR